MIYSTSSAATKIKKIGKSSLNYELNQLDLARRAELRMQHHVKLRFRAKYGSVNSNAEATSRKISDVKMYETHWPGFCYHRDGQMRNPSTSFPFRRSSDFQNMVDLLFTNGELDADKVLCLHLIATHPCETLKPPKKSHRAFSFLSREQSPLERLIERSRARNSPTRGTLVGLLPTYVINLSKEEYKNAKGKTRRDDNECLINDGRLASRLLMNDNISRLVQTVLEALQRSNPSKMSEILKLSQDPRKLKDILLKNNIQQFMTSLTGQPLVSSCDSFYLSQPFRCSVPLAVNHPTSSLEKLVTDIRHNVLRVPRESSKRLLKKYGGISETPSAASPSKISTVERPKPSPGMSMKDSRVSNQSKYFDVERLATMLSNKVREANERDVKEFKKSLQEDTKSKKSEERHQSRNSFCPVCMDKWKEPLPKPKVYMKKISGIDQNALKNISKSTHMITLMIKDEINKMEKREQQRKNEVVDKLEKQRERRRSSSISNDGNRRSSYLLRKAKNYAQFYGYKPGQSSAILNNLNVAKLKHQISVRENIKKVQKFLDEPLHD